MGDQIPSGGSLNPDSEYCGGMGIGSTGDPPFVFSESPKPDPCFLSLSRVPSAG